MAAKWPRRRWCLLQRFIQATVFSSTGLPTAHVRPTDTRASRRRSLLLTRLRGADAILVPVTIPAIVDLDRYRLFALFDALEVDLRATIRDFVVAASSSDAEALGSTFPKVVARRADDPDSERTETPLWEYLDLGDEIDLLNERKATLPPELASAMRQATPSLKEAVPVRNRVMHRRPLLPDDLDRSVQALEAAASCGIPLTRVHEVCQQILDDPSWVPSRLSAFDTHPTRVIHNLPLPEYDDTGLIGRRAELEELLAALLRRRYPVLSVLGPGGIGKTALAVETLYRLIDHDACPYDAILWTSLKTERLTAEGIRPLRDPISSLGEVVPELAHALDDSYTGTIDDLAQTLEGIEALVVVDNLETASAEEVVELVEAMPDSVNFLFTSRIGLGQLERRFSVDTLSDAAAGDLFRRLMRVRGLEHLAKLPPSDVTSLVVRLGRSPLALRWLVLSLEGGQRLETLLASQEPLLDFCVRNVYGSLPEEAHTLAEVLHVLGRAVSVQELSLYVDLPADDLRRAVHELQRRSLVRTTALVGGEVAEAFELTESAEAFIASAAPPDHSKTARVRSLDANFRRAEERRRLDEARAPLAPQTVVTEAESQRPAALVLRGALLSSRRGQVEDALAMVNHAAEMNPEYFENERVRGFIYSTAGDSDRATVAYERALELVSDAQRPRVQFFYAGHLLRCASDPASALPLAMTCHDALDNDDTASLLGTVQLYLGEVQQAIRVFDTVASRSEGKANRIARTQAMEARRRFAELLTRAQRKPVVALGECVSAVRIGVDALDEGVLDDRMIETLISCISEGFLIARELVDPEPAVDAVLELAEVARRNRVLFQHYRGFGLVLSHGARLVGTPGWPQEVLHALHFATETGVEGSAELIDLGTRRGRIARYRPDRGFGFVDVSGIDADVFFHRSDLAESADEILLRRGAPVALDLESSQRGFSARHVLLYPDGEPPAQALRGREGRVEKVLSQYAFARDVDTGATVFIGAHVFSSPSNWRELEPDVVVTYDVVIDSHGRFRAAPGSVSVATIGSAP